MRTDPVGNYLRQAAADYGRPRRHLLSAARRQLMAELLTVEQMADVDANFDTYPGHQRPAADGVDTRLAADAYVRLHQLHEARQARERDMWRDINYALAWGHRLTGRFRWTGLPWEPRRRSYFDEQAVREHLAAMLSGTGREGSTRRR